MKKILFINLFFILFVYPNGQEKFYFQKANQFYKSGDYQGAKILYLKLLNQDPKNYILNYNLANTYYQQSLKTSWLRKENLAQAIFHYKKSLQANKLFTESFNNLTTLLAQIDDLTSVENEKVSRYLIILIKITSYLTSFLFSLILIIITLNILKKKKIVTKLLPWLLSYFFLLLIIIWGNSMLLNSPVSNVVIKGNTFLKDKPEATSQSLLTLKNGFLVTLKEKKKKNSNQESWVKIEKNGTSGWIQRKHLLEL